MTNDAGKGQKKPGKPKKAKPNYDQRRPSTKSVKAPKKPKSAAKNKTDGAPTAGRNWLAAIFNWGGTVLLWGVLLVGLVMGYFAYTLPDISDIDVIEKRPSMDLVTENGVQFATYGDLYGRMLKPTEIPDVMKHAVLATEDTHFYNHFGVNPFSLVRALWRNYQAGRVVEGGSTITQQLAKNLFLTPDRNIQRKIREVLLAFWLEANYDKEQILALYLNRVYFGSGTYGIDAATRKYFAKDVKGLTTAEAAMLAGLLKAPTYYAPTGNLKRAQQRSTVVIRRMQDAGYLDKSTADNLVKNPAKLQHAGSNFKNIRYFSDWVVSEVRSFVGRTDQDLTIVTSLDLALQSHAEKAIEQQLGQNAKKFGVSQAALVAMAPSGEVKAMVGGRSYRKSSFNRATAAKRQPGSVFKTVVYAAGFEQGRAPEDIYNDGPININGWKPSNYTRKYLGNVNLREAYARSINTVAIKLTEDIGRHRVAQMASRLGLSGKMPAHPSISLGTNEVTLLEMSTAYAVIANGGRAVLPYAVKEIRNKKGQILYKRQSSGLGKILKGSTVNKMRDVMMSAMKTGTGRAANPGFPAAGKTGTTQDYRDAWFIGFTPNLVTGVWFGNDNGTATKKVTGSNLPSYTWKSFVANAVSKQKAVTFAAVREEPAESQNSIWQRIVSTFSSDNNSQPRRLEPETTDSLPAEEEAKP